MAEQVAPWRSQKIWFAVLGVGALVALALTGKITLDGMELAGIVMALIAGRAYEGAAATKAG
jgi:hypothetical protein